MNKLPKETLILLFSQLDVEDRLECILVCRNWYTVITENILYKKLNFSNIDRFNKAIDLFDEKRSFGCFVNDLTIKGCEIDIFSILSMPKLFPNVKNLSWEENIRSEKELIATDISIKDFPPPHVYHREFKKWNHFKRIVIGLERFPLMSMLLESTLLPNLTYLCIDFEQLHIGENLFKATVLKVHPIVKTIIKNLKSAPSLNFLELYNAVLDLDDMEELHTCLPMLKAIKTYCTSIYSESMKTMSIGEDGKSILDSDGVVIAQETASTVEKVSFDFYASYSPAIHDIHNGLKDTMIKWLLYIGCKYNSAEIIFKQRYIFLPVVPEFENPILTIISKMSNIKEYDCSLYPITKSIMDAMDAKDETKGRLEYLLLCTHVIESIKTQLQHVGVSKQAETISRLSLMSYSMLLKNGPTLKSILSGLSQNFQSLINLELICTIHPCALVELFQALPALRILTLDHVNFDENENVPVMPIPKCQVQSLSVTIHCKTNSTMLQLNQVMEFILQSCTLLADFTLNGDILSSNIGMLRLYFLQHEKLKNITIDVTGVQYYNFPWKDGKQGIQWTDYNNQVETNDITGKKLHIDIAWSSKNVVLDLEKAPVEE
ncbi:uncharacterized protein EV154DRAFT_504623 [Mucor mucedo]|uniref:uncharacterized protein n=1 Tax=Mucor mucedo TaxID=29922 RepID=UPI002220B70E|nr:uncharacterized protein EV154DRAFT_504623 [Mucor mucedo]KAI7892492.1 hypothetical protein EV154DRAFT_504623 [Mucor mucedo]